MRGFRSSGRKTIAGTLFQGNPGEVQGAEQNLTAAPSFINVRFHTRKSLAPGWSRALLATLSPFLYRDRAAWSQRRESLPARFPE